MNLSYPLLMGLGTGSENEGGELNYLMMAQMLNGMGAGQQNEEMNKQFQKMMMAPIAKRFSENLSRKIMALSNEGKARLLASLVTDVMGRKQEGDIAAMMDMCAMSGIMGLLNGTAVQSSSVEQPSELGLGIGGRQMKKIGGAFKGILQSPAEEVKRLQVPPSNHEQTMPQKKIRGRL